jgi:hypothetical protein
MDDMAVPAPAARYESYTHEAMAAEVAAGNAPDVAGAIGGQWGDLAEQLHQVHQGVAALSNGSHDEWRGEAGDAVRAALAKASGWLDHAAGVSSGVGGSVGEQAAVAARARAEMPPPVPYDPGAMIRSAVAGGNLFDIVALPASMSARRAASEAARTKAIDVMNTRDAGLAALAGQESFAVPPVLAQP